MAGVSAERGIKFLNLTIMSIFCNRPKINPESRYSVTQSAKRLGLHRNTIRNYCNSGILEYSYRVGNRKVILGKDLIKLWELANKKSYDQIGFC